MTTEAIVNHDLMARLEVATEGNRELDAAITLVIERETWPHVQVRELTGDDSERRHHALRDKGSVDDWAIIHGGDWGAIEPVPHYTISLDAALTLVPDGWSVTLYSHKPECHAEIYLLGDFAEGKRPLLKGPFEAECVPTPALALCIVALKARAAALVRIKGGMGK